MLVADMVKKGASAEELFEEARRQARSYILNLRESEKFSVSPYREADIPTMHVIGRTLAEVWENATMALLAHGTEVHTHYDPGADKKVYRSFPSLEGTVMLHIEEPFGEPRFHRKFLGGWHGFGDYKAEIEGVKDHWMISPAEVVKLLKEGKFDEIKNDTRWQYTYHQRLTAYPFIDIKGNPQTVDQISSVIKKLSEDPLSRSAQAITWDPSWDHNDGQRGVLWGEYHSPCLQSLWFRLLPFEKGYKLNANSRWRSRDDLKAVPQNIYGITEVFLKNVSKGLEESLGVPVVIGRYVDMNDSLHLYGHYFDIRQQGKDAESYLQWVFNIADGQSFEERAIIPGTPMYELMQEEIEEEYQKRVAHPETDLALS